eukprot:TRINITY_DN1154_c3_g1_i1.p1 TRINITY_DN1154_c3_g1~~TRINITY_DN1154_c3_g1_i1.p1  ORF type:complete len:379 (+),score=76.60 TRINITY_DN1154_c3_g1_i1:84-1220(+)
MECPGAPSMGFGDDWAAPTQKQQDAAKMPTAKPHAVAPTSPPPSPPLDSPGRPVTPPPMPQEHEPLPAVAVQQAPSMPCVVPAGFAPVMILPQNMSGLPVMQQQMCTSMMVQPQMMGQCQQVYSVVPPGATVLRTAVPGVSNFGGMMANTVVMPTAVPPPPPPPPPPPLPEHEESRFGGSGGRKVFVGQLPKDVTRDQLKSMMVPFGPIDDVHVLRDQAGQGTGAAFVLFKNWKDARAAIDHYDGKVHLSGVARPVRCRLAEGEVRPEFDVKLFVGHVPYDAQEGHLRYLFAPFGTILEIVLLSKTAGGGRVGAQAAFIRYDSLSSAERAIAALNHKVTLPGGSQPISVSIAHTEAEKRRKREARTAASMAPPGCTEC